MNTAHNSRSNNRTAIGLITLIGVAALVALTVMVIFPALRNEWAMFITGASMLPWALRAVAKS